MPIDEVRGNALRALAIDQFGGTLTHGGEQARLGQDPRDRAGQRAGCQQGELAQVDGDPRLRQRFTGAALVVGHAGDQGRKPKPATLPARGAPCADCQIRRRK